MAAKFLCEQRIRIKNKKKKRKKLKKLITRLYSFFFPDWSERIALVIMKLLSLKVTIRFNILSSFFPPSSFLSHLNSVTRSRGKKRYIWKAVWVSKSILSRTKAHRVIEFPPFLVSLLFAVTVCLNPLFL